MLCDRCRCMMFELKLLAVVASCSRNYKCLKVEFNFRIILNFNQEGCQGGSVLSLLLVTIQQGLNFLIIDNNNVCDD